MNFANGGWNQNRGGRNSQEQNSQELTPQDKRYLLNEIDKSSAVDAGLTPLEKRILADEVEREILVRSISGDETASEYLRSLELEAVIEEVHIVLRRLNYRPRR